MIDPGTFVTFTHGVGLTINQTPAYHARSGQMKPLWRVLTSRCPDLRCLEGCVICSRTLFEDQLTVLPLDHYLEMVKVST